MASQFESFDSSSEFDVYCATNHFARGCGGDLVVVGYFSNADGYNLDRICILRGGELVPLNNNNSDEGPLVDNTIFDLIEYKSDLYITGQFSGGVAKLNKETGEFDTLSTGLNGLGANGRALAVYNGLLIIGGDFNDAGGVSNTYKIAAWDGTQFLTMYSPPAYPDRYFAIRTIRGLAVYEGQLYICGTYKFFEGTTGTDDVLARFTGSGYEIAQDNWKGEYGLQVFEGEIWGHSPAGNINKYPGGALIQAVGGVGGLGVALGKIVIGGGVTTVEGFTVTDNVAGYSAETGWVNIGNGFSVIIGNQGLNHTFEYNGEMYIVGDFSSTDHEGDDIFRVAKLDEENNRWIRAGNTVGGINLSGLRMAEIQGIKDTYPQP